MSNRMLPSYDTVLFTDIWDDVEEFSMDFSNSPFAGCISSSSPDNVSILFYLLYARYGNNPIANRDINQWKFKIFSIIFQYGPTWEKRLDIQSKLRGLLSPDQEAELLKSSKAIFNHAFNPSTSPSTSSLQELSFINDQSTSNYTKSKMDAYMQLWELLRTDVTEEFLSQFKKCFKIFVSPEMPLLYETEYDEEEEE